MGTHVDVLLVTANVGSLFGDVGELESDWRREFFTAVQTYKPRFVALHFQEVGGKNYKVNMGQAENFLWSIESSEEMREFDRVCVYVDNNVQVVETFTALGSMYFIHKSLKNIYQYDFNVQEFKAVSGHNKYVGPLEGVTTVETEKFPKNFRPENKWSRKGYMRTRWMINNQGLDLVNVHLFHDTSNLIACSASPSVYSGTRQKTLRYVISRISDASHPFFVFGDFNFRLDTLRLVESWTKSADVNEVKDSSNEVVKIIAKEKDNDHKVLLQIEKKRFAYLHEGVFREDNGRALQKYNKESTAFQDIFTEEAILFPPSYPYSEDYNKPTQYANTRCPAWCDRILMSHSARDVVQRTEDGASGMVYNTLGSSVCMGDHKPVFLSFGLKTSGL